VLTAIVTSCSQVNRLGRRRISSGRRLVNARRHGQQSQATMSAIATATAAMTSS
jgi:hypothetical protein